MRGTPTPGGAARPDDGPARAAAPDAARAADAGTGVAANVRVWPAAPAVPDAGADTGTTPLGVDTPAVEPQAWAFLQRHAGLVRGGRGSLDESFRLLRHRLRQDLRSRSTHVLAVTSPRTVAGRPLFSLNLALTLAADVDATALLIDADLSGQGVQTLFGLPGRAGLAEHLSQGWPLDGLWIDPGVERLRFLPAGVGPVPNPTELLASRAAAGVARALREHPADGIVVVDLPPLLHSADALAFLPHVEATLLVVEEHTTPRADLESCAELLAPYPLIGTVMCPPAPRSRESRWWSRWWQGRRG